MLDHDKNLNYQFINSYIEYLKKFTNEKFIKEFLEQNNSKLKKFNNAIYKDNSKVDKINRIGLGYFVYDEHYLYKRSEFIKERIDLTNLDSVTISKINDVFKYEDYEASQFPLEAQTFNCLNPNDKKKMYLAGKMEIKFNNTCKKIKLFDHRGNSKIFDLEENIVLSSKNIVNFRDKFKNIKTHASISKESNDEFVLKEDLNIYENTLLNKKNKLIIKNKNINVKNNAILLIEGKIEFENSKKNPTQIYSSDGTGSLIFIGNKFEFKDLIFKNLSSPKLNDLILYGGVNFINSEILLENITFNNSNDEDAINIINSKSFLSNVRFENIFADALDIDFGKSNFDNIECYNINNDCLDISGAQINGSKLFTLDTNDKGISIGENSKVKIKNITHY